MTDSSVFTLIYSSRVLTIQTIYSFYISEYKKNIEEVSSDNWDHQYSRKDAAYPHAYLINNKYWSPVSRIDNVYGGRNLFCVCPPIDEYEEVKAG